MIAETRKYIFRWRSHFRRRRVCQSSLITLGNSENSECQRIRGRICAFLFNPFAQWQSTRSKDVMSLSKREAFVLAGSSKVDEQVSIFFPVAIVSQSAKIEIMESLHVRVSLESWLTEKIALVVISHKVRWSGRENRWKIITGPECGKRELYTRPVSWNQVPKNVLPWSYHTR